MAPSIADTARPVWFTFDALFAWCDLHANRIRLPGVLIIPDWFPRYFDRQGFPVPSTDGDPMSACLTWARLRESMTIEDVLVARDDLPDGSYLSTVWLGLDHGFGGRPLIFETMRFAGETIPLELPSGHIMESHAEREFPDPFDPDGEPTTQLRYTSEEEASAAHHEIVRRIRITEGH